MMKPSIVVWFVLVSTNIVIHGIGLRLLIKLKRKKVSDNLIMLLSVMEMGSEITRLVYSIIYLKFGLHNIVSIRIEHSTITSFVVGQLIALAFITLDRGLKVKFAIRYDVLVTKRKLIFACVFCLLLSVGNGCITWYFPFLFHKMLSAWKFIVLLILFGSYIYIFIHLKFIRRRLFGVDGNNLPMVQLNLRVPISIMATFVIFWLIPDILLAAQIIKLSPWIHVVFGINITFDGIIYIWGVPKLRDGFTRTKRGPSKKDSAKPLLL